MDPLSMLMLCVAAAWLLTRTIGTAVTDVAASVRGQTPPSLERWRRRQDNRKARGEAPEKEPGVLGRWWHDAVEAHSVKAAQKHQARMEILEEDAGDNVEAYKEKMRRAAERRDLVGATVAGWGTTSWEYTKATVAKVKAKVKDAAEEIRERRDEEAAGDEDSHRDDDVIDAEIVDITVDPDDAELADVIPIRPDDDPAEASPDDPSSRTDRSDTVTVSEITDLSSAIEKGKQRNKYFSTVTSELAEQHEMLEAAKEGLDAEVPDAEQDKAAVQGRGFKVNVTGHYDSIMSSSSAAADKIKAALAAIAEAREEIANAASAQLKAVNVFEKQLGVAETVGAAASGDGVAKDTAFYTG